MSQKTCPRCGSRLKPNAKFCSYCGVRLEQPEEPSPNATPTLISQPYQQIQQGDQSSSAPVFTSSQPHLPPTQPPEPMPADVEASLILRSRLEQLQTERDKLEEEIETIRVKHLVGELSEEEAEKETKRLKAKLDPITKEIDDLKGKARTPLELIQLDKRTQEERLRRLEALRQSGEVEPAIYQRLSSEYRAKLEDLTRRLEEERKKAHRWLRQLEERRKQLEFDKETLEVRVKLDELSPREVAEQIGKLEKELEKVDRIITGLRSVLGIEPPSTSPATPQSTQPSTPATPSTTPMQVQEPHRCPYCRGRIAPNSKYCHHCGRLLTE